MDLDYCFNCFVLSCY